MYLVFIIFLYEITQVFLKSVPKKNYMLNISLVSVIRQIFIFECVFKKVIILQYRLLRFYGWAKNEDASLAPSTIKLRVTKIIDIACIAIEFEKIF